MNSTKKLITHLTLITIGVLLILLTACQAQIVEIEVTRVVTETETVVEEIVVEKEVEVVKEVEVEKEVEVAPEVVEEAAETEDGAAMEDSPGDIEATGSEDDDGGSPFSPTKGKVGTDQQVAQKMGWIQASGVITDPLTVRVLASRTEDMVIVMAVTAEGEQQELIITHQIQRYRQSGSQSLNNDQLYLTISSASWQELAQSTSLLLTSNITEGLQCDFCAAGESGERYTLIIEDQVLTFEIDADEQVPELDQFLSAMRSHLTSSSQYAQGVWSRTE